MQRLMAAARSGGEALAPISLLGVPFRKRPLTLLLDFTHHTSPWKQDHPRLEPRSGGEGPSTQAAAKQVRPSTLRRLRDIIAVPASFPLARFGCGQRMTGDVKPAPPAPA